jgi:TolA-binding protein
MRTLLILALIAIPASAAPPSTCGATDDYSRALCSYQKRQFPAAEKGFRAIVDGGVQDPATIKALYFLGRTYMKTGRFADAEATFIRIYETDKPFYDDWQCDYLLGEARKAQGKG